MGFCGSSWGLKGWGWGSHPYPSSQRRQANPKTRRDASLRPLIGTINVILVAPGRTGSCPSKVMFVARLFAEGDDWESKKAKKRPSPVLGFSDKDKIGTIQPHNDALVVTLRICLSLLAAGMV